MKNISISLAQILTGVVAVSSITAGIVLWSQSEFQSKEQAKADKEFLDMRVQKVEAEVLIIRSDLSTIKSDTSYIKGRLEPRN